jgi:hypothetical protein
MIEAALRLRFEVFNLEPTTFPVVSSITMRWSQN